MGESQHSFKGRTLEALLRTPQLEEPAELYYCKRKCQAMLKEEDIGPFTVYEDHRLCCRESLVLRLRLSSSYHSFSNDVLSLKIKEPSWKPLT